ncbi:hypothetical protein GZ77_10780 [Endozoicomonas montiporae]|uniref:Uncharacterized protein n=2 Tax=Endozoicomonas montiporae TaxID=1027273 RepID=A0A081N8J2_9GAMM|nr:hypothetical protein [Endozoicomonas montiporae]KEQ14765.1 hypothetical protein GZ77_10780 [Endozoicomonas montiporae]
MSLSYVYYAFVTLGIMTWDKGEFLWKNTNGDLHKLVDNKSGFIFSLSEDNPVPYDVLPVEQKLSSVIQTISYSCVMHFRPQSGDIARLINEVVEPCVFYARPGVYFITTAIRLKNQALMADLVNIDTKEEWKNTHPSYSQLVEQADFSRSFMVSLSHETPGHVIAGSWYLQTETQKGKVILVPVVYPGKRQNAWIYLNNNSHMSDVILVNNASTFDFTGIVSDYSYNTIGETGFFNSHKNVLDSIVHFSGGGEKGNKRESHSGSNRPVNQPLTLRGSFRGCIGIGGAGGNGQDDDEKNWKPHGHLSPLFGVIPVTVPGLDHLGIILKALLAYLFIPDETPVEFIDRLLSIFYYLQQSVAPEDRDLFFNNFLLQLGSGINQDLSGYLNPESLRSFLYEHDHLVRVGFLQQDVYQLKKKLEVFLGRLVWPENEAESQRLLVDTQMLVETSQASSIEALGKIKKTIVDNQELKLKHAELERKKTINNKLEAMGLKITMTDNEIIMLKLIRHSFLKTPDVKFFTGINKTIVEILANALGNEKIDELAGQLGSGFSYQSESLYRRLELLIIIFFRDGGTRQALVQALVRVLGGLSNDIIERLKEAVVEEPAVDVDKVLGTMVFSLSVNPGQPVANVHSELQADRQDHHQVQPCRRELIAGIESFLRENQAEGDQGSLNRKAIDQLTQLLTATQIQELYTGLRSQVPCLPDIQSGQVNLHDVIQWFFESFLESEVYAMLAKTLYQIFEQTMSPEKIADLLERRLSGFSYASGSGSHH